MPDLSPNEKIKEKKSCVTISLVTLEFVMHVDKTFSYSLGHLILTIRQCLRLIRC